MSRRTFTIAVTIGDYRNHNAVEQAVLRHAEALFRDIVPLDPGVPLVQVLDDGMRQIRSLTIVDSPLPRSNRDEDKTGSTAVHIVGGHRLGDDVFIRTELERRAKEKLADMEATATTAATHVVGGRRPDDPVLQRLPWSSPAKPSFATVHRSFNGTTEIWLGSELDGFDAYLRHYQETAMAAMFWGCRRLDSESAARAHWVNNQSMVSGELRPHATMLIDLVARICRFNNWKW